MVSGNYPAGPVPLTRLGTPPHDERRPFPPRYLFPMPIQVFGTKNSADTRAALRFFAERRIKLHFVDLAERAASPGELRRFAQKFGVAAMVDRESRRFGELGLRSAAYGEEKWLSLLGEEPLVLRQPLVRNGNLLSIGLATATWKEWTGK